MNTSKKWRKPLFRQPEGKPGFAGFPLFVAPAGASQGGPAKRRPRAGGGYRSSSRLRAWAMDSPASRAKRATSSYSYLRFSTP